MRKKQRANPWPFKSEQPAVQGYLRSREADRAVQDLGHGVRVYPDRRSEKGRGFVVDGIRRTCSNSACRKLARCAHLWEDDFRFGQYRGQLFAPPAELALKIEAQASTAYANVPRLHARPNPVVDGLRSATIVRHAREDMPVEVPRLAADLAHFMRTDIGRWAPATHSGRPATDLVDLALAAALRIAEGWTYEQLASQIPLWEEAGYLRGRFAYGRLVEAMTSSSLLTQVLDSMCLRIEEFFRLVGDVFVTDGAVFSTARSDNARTSRYARGTAVRITCHSQYELRWGLLTGFRLTWSQRGRGSGEAPQYPYITRMTMRTFRPQFDLADAAFATDRNFKFADDNGYRLLSPINPQKFNIATKRHLTLDRARFHLAECDMRNPGTLMQQLYPFRSRVEGWHSVIRDQTKTYVISRPDRANMPLTRAEDTKKHPERSYVGLPDDQVERDALIEKEQFVGLSVINEMHARRLVLHLRALVKASAYYRGRVDFFNPTAFMPRLEDAAFSPHRRRDIAA